MDARKSQKASYRDDPDALSLHTTPGDDSLPELASSSSTSPPPPTYDETTHYTDPDAGRFEFAGLNVREDHFAKISRTRNVCQQQSKTHISGEHVRIQYARADSDPEYLQQWVEYMSRQAPTPYIVITGTHTEQQRESDGKKKRVEVTDFSIRISMRNYLWPSFRLNDPTMMNLSTVDNGIKTWRGTVLKKRAPGSKGDIEVGQAKPTLQEWCHRCCASSSKTRIFRLTRTVTGFNEEQVREQLTPIIRSTGYKGHLDITFPVADRAVDIYTTTRLNTWRLTTWICWVFYLTFLWIFAWPVLYITTKRYDIVRAAWPFSTVDAHGHRQYTTVSEQQWIDKYALAIKQLAYDGYEGIVGDEKLNQILARPETHRPAPLDFRHAHAAVGAVLGASGNPLNAVSQVGNLLRFAGGSNDEVGWGYDT